ncbi:MAG: helix-turn-helix domain-containing protein [Bacteroidota bacterium]
MSSIVSIDSVSQVHQSLGLPSPQHPLITVVKTDRIQDFSNFTNVKLVNNLYQVAFKEVMVGNLNYGRNSYDFQDGTLVFTAPGQVSEYTVGPHGEANLKGWSLVFHPDLIRRSDLAEKIGAYGFFDYASNEALHLSQVERNHVEELKDKIEFEYSHKLDYHSLNLINSNLELLLDYCLRYYDRQFLSRTDLNQDVISKFNIILKSYYSDSKEDEFGLPSLSYCANQLNLSPKYLSDLLKKETGKAALEHIHLFVVEKAKNILINSNDSISQVAYSLGFDYPQHFSTLFKSKTGLSPRQYRNLN